jgi:peptide deformylase
MDIFKMGADVLRQKAEDVKEIDGRIADLLEEMIETMILAPGIGLAGPQVGVPLRLFVMNVEENEFDRVINPVILETGGVSTYNEGCLSVPGIYEDVVRPDWIKVKYLDENGKEHIVERDELWARCFLHEYDHLEGKLFVDYLNKKQLRFNRIELATIEREGKKQNK